MVTTTKAQWAVEKHAATLGNEFGKCAACHGTTGKVVDGKMGCSRAGATVVWLTSAHTMRCDGNKPVFIEDAWPAKTAITRIGQLSAA